MFATTTLGVRLATLIAALGFVVPLTAAPAHAYPCGKVSGCSSFELVSAGASYHWYPVAKRFEFKGGRAAPSAWKLSGRGRQYQQNGMLTIVGSAGTHRAPVASTWKGEDHASGRWESRLRTRTYGDGVPFRVQLALVPAAKSARACGGQDVTFLDYSPTKASTTRLGVNTLPNLTHTFSKKLTRTIGSEEWHVFGVEVTKKHIAWFIDAKVVAIEKRPAALSGATFRMQARLVPTSTHKKVEKTRLQLDWARYWTMKKKGKKLHAPAPLRRTVNASAC